MAGNGYLPGFLAGRIYQGPLKQLCAPGLNCYSCPGALLSCPIGAMQSVLTSRGFWFSYYVFGFLLLVGALAGRFVCGWLCPFGWAQELLHKIPFPKKIRAFRLDRGLRYVKYGILLIFVILLPLFWVDRFGLGQPYFCKYVCPAGMLQAGIPLVALDEGLRAAVGWLFAWKGVLLGMTIFASLMIYRPFCKYLCPLGAAYGLLNPISLHRLRLSKDACIHCGKCAMICKMNVDPQVRPSSPECIRCGDCARGCPAKALRMGIRTEKHTPS